MNNIESIKKFFFNSFLIVLIIFLVRLFVINHLREVFMRTLDVIVAVLLVVGGLNWGLVGLFDFDLVANFF